MRRFSSFFTLKTALILLALAALPVLGRSVELKVSRAALDRTLKQQLFSGPDGRYYLKGDAKSACSVYAYEPELSFVADRIVVKIKTRARLGKSLAGDWLVVDVDGDLSVKQALTARWTVRAAMPYCSTLRCQSESTITVP